MKRRSRHFRFPSCWRGYAACFPGNKSEESIDRFLSQRHIIELYLEQEKEYSKNVEALKAYDSSELFTIAGNRFHNSGIKFTPGMPLRLIKGPDNQFDRNAIAVYSGDANCRAELEMSLGQSFWYISSSLLILIPMI